MLIRAQGSEVVWWQAGFAEFLYTFFVIYEARYGPLRERFALLKMRWVVSMRSYASRAEGLQSERASRPLRREGVHRFILPTAALYTAQVAN